MESWFVFLVSLSVATLLKSLFDLFKPGKKHGHKLPPGPLSLPFLGNPLWLRPSLPPVEPILRSLHAKHGPVVSLRFGTSPRPFIFVSSHSLAHQALINHGAAFADRPPAPPTTRIASSNQHNISSAAYGPTWRLLRRNLTSQIFHPSRGVPSFSPLRRRVLAILHDRLESQSRSGEVVVLLDHFKHAMFCLLVFMCFGDDGAIDDQKIKEIMEVQNRVIVNSRRFRVLDFWPTLGKLLLRSRWKEFMKMLSDRSSLFAPLIRRRITAKSLGNPCYVDTLMGLELPEEGNRKLTEGEMVSLCSEFIIAGADTTTTALQWIMANLVKYPHIQETLFAEVGEAVNRRNQGRGPSQEQEEAITAEEEDLQKMPYLKAVILEGLRRHPPGHLVVPHAVTEEVELGGYTIPKNATVNFMVAEMGWDPEVWDDPMAFKPERFVANACGSDGEEGGFDITGTGGIKMMPFGAGRRICPGLGVAMLHLEYFVANLVWRFEWKRVEGEDVDFTEKDEMTVAMKNPLRAVLSPRISKTTHTRVA